MKALDVGSDLEGGEYIESMITWSFVSLSVHMCAHVWALSPEVRCLSLSTFFFFGNNICHWTWHLFVQITWLADKAQWVSCIHSLALLLQGDTTRPVSMWVLVIQCCSSGLSSTVWKPVCTVQYYVALNMHGFLTHLPEFQGPQSFNECPLKEGDKGE